ncbi:hypothetical protein [Burkholderia pseudomallei]|uniref:hypothetical protein n=2 Tax=Burkholderia pseudomallei TaxID=28450 RepID=UPI00050E4300|nr:hypothetical protein [Burkholderia pseudomallei]KGW97678.1 hypothetical protein Y048_6058 [Burkholderia pseudomallei MSHR456]KGC40258.1 hypothetical protein DO73_5086 [Burkholderia pseudomallei]KGD18158.1 hypothetical protein DO70_4637 [Burkholderia pseudomallei]KGD25295.1 hypothetical protein DP42_5504 [Burkholderia pseudomallei]KGD31538.1 hypothetical protein DP59_5966 [Burkholderia pseudomallei]
MLSAMPQIEVQRKSSRTGDFLRTALQGEFQAFCERRFFFERRHGRIVRLHIGQADNQSGY